MHLKEGNVCAKNHKYERAQCNLLFNYFFIIDALSFNPGCIHAHMIENLTLKQSFHLPKLSTPSLIYIQHIICNKPNKTIKFYITLS